MEGFVFPEPARGGFPVSGRGLRIAAIRLLCPEPERTARFYEGAFDCQRDRAVERIALHLGAQRIDLVPAAARPVDPAPANATTFQHFAIVVSDMEAAYERLREVPGWSAISRAGPERLPAASAGVTAFKFRDCDGHPLELLAFRPDAVPPAWQGAEGLFLGIDHTAITIAETERSIAFYGQLGFAPASRSLNHGPEQARLDAIDAPVLAVTGLRPPGGAPPHLELLCYRKPEPLCTTVPSDSVLATRIVLADIAEADEAGSEHEAIHTDPDGHRLAENI
jgi:catechol 2,3-dioxygenase-like lactoylglutathione lyase family enzyme